MSDQPEFTITLALRNRGRSIAALRKRIVGATIEVLWIPTLKSDSRARNSHSSTTIEGDLLTVEQIRAIEE